MKLNTTEDISKKSYHTVFLRQVYSLDTKIYDNKQKSEDAYDQYKEAINPSSINNYYKTHQKHNKETSKLIMYTALNLGVFIYVYFFESWSDLSEYYASENNKPLRVALNQNESNSLTIKLTYNF